MPHNPSNIPSWMLESEDYEPTRDRDAFISHSLLALGGVLRHFRLDDGRPWAFSPSAPAKLVFCLACILLTSLSTNYLFSLVMLALVLGRMATLTTWRLKRAAAVCFGAAGLTFLIMSPATLIGQGHSAVLISTKVLITTGIAMLVALTTPYNELTGALRSFRVPDLFVMTIDLALKNINHLGIIATEVMEALRLRSVGHNSDKGGSAAGVAGVVLLKSGEAAQATFEAMQCRGFEGEYQLPHERAWRTCDLAWAAILIILCVLFAHLQVQV